MIDKAALIDDARAYRWGRNFDKTLVGAILHWNDRDKLSFLEIAELLEQQPEYLNPVIGYVDD